MGSAAIPATATLVAALISERVLCTSCIATTMDEPSAASLKSSIERHSDDRQLCRSPAHVIDTEPPLRTRGVDDNLSAFLQPEDQERGQLAGCQALLPKPPASMLVAREIARLAPTCRRRR